MQLPIYQVDAFTRKVFEGNPAAVVPLDAWLPDTLMQKIASENNLSETVFFVKNKDRFHIRWFTSTVEARMCGHATLASAFVLFNYLGFEGDVIHFDSLSGPLLVERKGDQYALDFPAQNFVEIPIEKNLIEALGVSPKNCYESIDRIVLLENEAQVKGVSPDFNKLLEIDTRGVIITAPSESYDFVSRFFAPRSGILEDPVTGSAHTQLAPFWAEMLGKATFHAKQVSQRGGELFLSLDGDRVIMSGEAILFLKGYISLG